MICWKCKKEIDVLEIHRSTECPLCHADLHCCKNCSFYSPGSHYDCKETVEDVITDKEKSNFCDYFRVNKNISSYSDNDKAKAAKDAFNALFG